MRDTRTTGSDDDFAGRRDRFRHYESPAVVAAYLQRLDRKWPERSAIADHIAARIAALEVATPLVLELCCGPGRLAQTLFQSLPSMRYTGVDISSPFLAYVRDQLAIYGERLTLHEVDLSDPTWPQLLSDSDAHPLTSAVGERSHRQFHAIVSMQSLHDVGDEQVLVDIYTHAKSLLLPGGFLLNADFVVVEGQELPGNPGRRSIPRHLELLTAAGYIDPRCTCARGNFGCVVGWK